MDIYVQITYIQTMIIDFHTHIFPDQVADQAIPRLEKEGGVKAFVDGTKASLLKSMGQAGIDKSVACMIATRPAQYDSILRWSKEIRSQKIIPFPSIHPDDPKCLQQIKEISHLGFKGIKMHPYYQEFKLTEDKMMPVYEQISATGLILLMHTGFDIAFPKTRLADPEKIVEVCSQFPKLKFVASHLGAWDLWPEVRQKMAGKNIYMDISFSLEHLRQQDARDIIINHPPEYILFGSDSPWADQQKSIDMLKNLKLNNDLFKMIIGENAGRLLGIL